ncbi:NAD(P)/FAD-dependent oxidoreductase [Planktotalea arctica]|uniref:NAD(P)/FAD-dependent oxidoreductase n=1 Tax=Planktotalea arctica TaxID=1481893 RepID=UPI00321C10A3
MNLLFSNDKRGEYPQSWYAATTPPLKPFAPLRGETRADVCIIGGGYTGLSAALHLAELGLDVALLEAHRVGFGASGRNGGQLGSGQRMDQRGLEKMLGRDHAHQLWDMAEDAKALVKDLIVKHDIQCHLKPGVAEMGFGKRDVAELQDYAHKLQDEYNYGEIKALDHDAAQALCPSPAYKGGMMDWGAAHLHPLSFALGLAKAAHGAGARIYEMSHVHHIKEGAEAIVQTDKGRIKAAHVILAGNGYLGNLNRKTAARVMPINNFIAATQPLGDDAAKVLAQDIAVADTKFVVNYFRLSHDNRLLFGGGESYGYRFPADIAAKVRKPMSEIFPHLRDVRIDYAWGGTLGITMKRMPYLARVAPNILSASGYSGHGIGNAVQAGKLMADAVHGAAHGFDTMAAVPAPSFPGAGAFRAPLLTLAMSWYALRDRLGV